MDEKTIAKHVIAWLRSSGFDSIYQEVTIPGGIADIIVDLGGIAWTIETKRTLSLELFSQADSRLRNGSNRVSVAYLRRRDSKNRDFSQRICKTFGIGMIEVMSTGHVRQSLESQLFRVRHNLLRFCKEEHRTYCEAGTANGGQWTPFKATADSIKSVVSANPGIPFAEMMQRIKHHYRTDATANSSLRKWIERGIVKGVRCEKHGNRILLFPA